MTQEIDIAEAPAAVEPADSREAAALMRRLSVAALHKAGGGHFGGTLSAVDIIAVLLSRLGWHPLEAGNHKLVLSKGHGAMALYSGLVAYGHLEAHWLDSFGRSPADLQGHPDIGKPVPLGFSTGSLGQGISAALGMAKVLQPSGHVACAVVGDGECQEGQVWEAAMVAERLGVGNMLAVIDANDHQEWGYRSDTGALPPVRELQHKWEAFGWACAVCDGHDHLALVQAIEHAMKAPGPGVVIARTTKGYGSRLLESDPDRFHCGNLTDAEFRQVRAELAA